MHLSQIVRRSRRGALAAGLAGGALLLGAGAVDAHGGWGRPDYVVERLSVDCGVGGGLTVNFAIANRSGTPALNPSVVRVLIDGVPQPLQATPPLGAGEVELYHRVYPFPGIGAHHVHVAADSADTVFELFEGNNGEGIGLMCP